MPESTTITPPRVPLVDPATGLISREWYRYFLNQFNFTGGSALTKTDDTNVTLTLGGSPTTALLNAASLTLGWSGTLAEGRGGTGAATFAAARTNLNVPTRTGTDASGTWGIDISGNAATATTAGAVTGGYVSSITGTANQVIASAATGAVTLSLPQSIHTAATPTFQKMNLAGAANASFYDTLIWEASKADETARSRMHAGSIAHWTFNASWSNGTVLWSQDDATLPSFAITSNGVLGNMQIRVKAAGSAPWFTAGGYGGWTIPMYFDPTGAINLPQTTATRLLATDSSKNIGSVADLSSWIAGTANRVTVANDGDGTITLSGPQDLHTGASPTFAGLTLSSPLSIGNGGTGQTTAGAAFNALSPMSALGDTLYGGASGAGTRLAGNTTTTRKFLRQTGDGVNSAAPAWDTLLAADVPGIASPAALTKTDDANVTLTLGGSPTTALLAAASLTLGWTGTLAVSRGGSGVATAAANQFFASPDGAPGAPGFRAMVAADVPTLNQNTTGSAASCTGNAATATALATARAINGTNFDGTAAITVPVNNTDDTTTNATMYPLWTATAGGNYAAKVSTTKMSFNPSTGILTATGFSGPLTGNVTGNASGTAANITGTAAIGNGGTGQTTASAAFGALSPLTTRGDILFYGASGNTRLGTGTAGQVLQSGGAGADPSWTAAGTGTVTSVALSLPTELTVSGSPVTTAGTLGATWASQTAAYVFAAPAAAPGTPTFRALVAGDIPTLNQNTTGTAANVTGIVALVNGGTGTAAASANAAFNALSPLTTLGDTLYGGAAGAGTRLAGNIATVRKFLVQIGDGVNSAAPTWDRVSTLELTNPGDITKVDDTNVTLTLGGTPVFSVLRSVSFTLGWTGSLAVARGGTGATTSATARTNLGVAIGSDVQAYNASLAAIAAGTWAGATSITTLGTITSGTWNAGAITSSGGISGTTGTFTGQLSVDTSGTGTSAQLKLTRTSVGSRYLQIGGSSELAILDTSGNYKAMFTNGGDLCLGTTTAPSAGSGKVLVFGDNAAQPTMGTNTAGLYGYDSGSGTVEMWAVDEAGNDTQISPHDADGFWVFHSRSRKHKRGVRIALERLIREKFPEYLEEYPHDPPERLNFRAAG